MTIERIAAARTAFGVDRQVGDAQRIEIAIDGAHGDAEAFGERLGGDAGASCSQQLGQGKQAFDAFHERPTIPDKPLTFSNGTVLFVAALQGRWQPKGKRK